MRKTGVLEVLIIEVWMHAMLSKYRKFYQEIGSLDFAQCPVIHIIHIKGQFTQEPIPSEA